ncbi:MAG TPA: DNA mismatch repair endonuclease MutL [Candidatus Blautia stercoripullorum]|uniref:DNA mismatch repair protein MutL n=1 Tax=Candidatus Blautia stercoripullorum TaxID=2838502 RepID=A0A9D2RB26_9FIRM|nr:DNA mismatch repair endonuclease MutL [Candidatus Blautia stercoripullorum]
MREIAVLDQNTIDKIAAGEVVERPASVVKELVENAIDAGATAITVEIKEGGISFIRVTDNGNGIPKDQVRLAFLRHATSKIQKVEDLLQISSLGFRGEALSSISAVSQMEVITKTPEDMIGVRYVIEGGREKSLEEIGAPNGTTMLVRNLFFNTPARAKFLKTAMTEAGYVSAYMEQLALSHQDISFKYMVNGQMRLHSSGNSNLRDVIYGIYGRDITRELLEVRFERPGILIEGFIGKPVVSRGNRNFENYYINGRYVKSKILMKAIEEAYKPYMMQHKYPFVCLQYTISGDEIDVNVHPTKMEVRFQNQGAVYNATYDMITQTLSGREMIPQVELESREEKREERKSEKKNRERIPAPEPFETGFRKKTEEFQKRQRTENPSAAYPVPEQIQEERPVYGKEAPAKKEEAGSPVGIHLASVHPPASEVSPPEIHKEQETEKEEQKIPAKENIPVSPAKEERKPEAAPLQPQQMELFDDRLLSKKARARHRIIGQLFETYWLVEYDNKFYIIDQHAAHEKVLYERFMKEFETREVTTQMVSPPQVISLNLQEDMLLKTHMEVFRQFGFEISEFGGREYSIHGVPANIYGISVQDLFVEILDSLENENSRQPLDIIAGRIATAACKAAVKGNNTLSFEEADQLIDELLGLENPYNCPHGRPTIISMTKYELEKKFKRIV